MSWPSQPRKKAPSKNANQGEGSKKPSPVSTPLPPVADVATLKKEIAGFQNKIADIIANGRRGTEKAAFILSQWINKKR